MLPKEMKLKYWLAALYALLLPLVLASCADLPDSSEGVSGNTDQSKDEYATLHPEDAKSRSVELQHQVLDLMPRQDFEGNNFPDIDADIKHRLMKCAPILSEEYYQEEAEAVQYPGVFVVRLDEGASKEEVAKKTYRSVVAELGMADADVGASPDDYGSYPRVTTEDGYLITISFTHSEDTPAGEVWVDVWSPCFIPEGGTLPPGRKI